MPVLRLTDEEFVVLYRFVVSSDCDWSKSQWAAFESMKAQLIEMNRIGFKKKMDSNKVWEALKGVVG